MPTEEFVDLRALHATKFVLSFEQMGIAREVLLAGFERALAELRGSPPRAN